MIDPREVSLLQEEVRICQAELTDATTRAVSPQSVTYRRAVLRLRQAQHELQVATEQLAEQRRLLQLIRPGQRCNLCNSDRLVAEPCGRHAKCGDCGGFSVLDR